jgi:hypothetical protein
MIGTSDLMSHGLKVLVRVAIFHSTEIVGIATRLALSRIEENEIKHLLAMPKLYGSKAPLNDDL